MVPLSFQPAASLAWKAVEVGIRIGPAGNAPGNDIPAIAAAGELRMDRADKLLDATVAEEKKTDQALTQLAETLVNPGG
jgi:Domain of unknown function (DUF892)